MTYLTASTSVPLGGSVWVEFMTPCALMSSVHGSRYGLKLKKRDSSGWGGGGAGSATSLQTPTGEVSSEVTELLK